MYIDMYIYICSSMYCPQNWFWGLVTVPNGYRRQLLKAESVQIIYIYIFDTLNGMIIQANVVRYQCSFQCTLCQYCLVCVLFQYRLCAWNMFVRMFSKCDGPQRPWHLQNVFVISLDKLLCGYPLRVYFQIWDHRERKYGTRVLRDFQIPCIATVSYSSLFQ